MPKLTLKTSQHKMKILATVNLDRILNNKARNMELELKIELLVTPRAAHKRLQEKKAEEAREAQERFMQESLRNQREGNRQLDRINRKLW